MKNVSSLNNNDSNSPKTPGGISKSLLTPCRRLGLSRNWRRSGPSPFISPLSGTSHDSEIEKKETRKRKERLSEVSTLEADNTTDCNDEVIDVTPTGNVNICYVKKSQTNNNVKKLDTNSTPSRSVGIPLRKKSKLLISAIDSSQVIPINTEKDTDGKNSDTNLKENIENISLSAVDNCHNINLSIVENIENCFTKEIINKHADKNENLIVAKPVKSKCKTKKSLSETKEKNNPLDKNIQLKENTKQNDIVYEIKDKSPNDLKKECVVVIQRKLFKNVKNNSQVDKMVDVPKTSDTEEDEPLIKLQQQNSKTIPDDDFIENQSKRSKVEIKTKPTKSPKNKLKNKKVTKIKENIIKQRPESQSILIDDDDDDDFDNRKTILVRKSYEKVTKPIKAKSTGSITQRDIDNIRNRIEAKKKLLLAQSLTPDTEELRNLIKKWQKGCQDALMELLDLMKNKFPDKERMNYSEMLQTLKIPPSLVGYDSDNDCFISPDDTSIILGQFNDL